MALRAAAPSFPRPPSERPHRPHRHSAAAQGAQAPQQTGDTCAAALCGHPADAPLVPLGPAPKASAAKIQHARRAPGAAAGDQARSGSKAHVFKVKGLYLPAGIAGAIDSRWPASGGRLCSPLPAGRPRGPGLGTGRVGRRVCSNAALATGRLVTCGPWQKQPLPRQCGLGPSQAQKSKRLQQASTPAEPPRSRCRSVFPFYALSHSLELSGGLCRLHGQEGSNYFRILLTNRV